MEFMHLRHATHFNLILRITGDATLRGIQSDSLIK